MSGTAGHRIFTTPLASVYPLYLAKVEKKGRTKAELDEVICWLTGYTPEGLAAQVAARADNETFFAERVGMVADKFGIGWMVVAGPKNA